MGHRWLDDSELIRVFLNVEDRACRHCGAEMHFCDQRRPRIEIIEGQRKIVCRLVKCIDRTCPGKRVQLWISDKQDDFLTRIAAEFAAVPHRFCQNR